MKPLIDERVSKIVCLSISFLKSFAFLNSSVYQWSLAHVFLHPWRKKTVQFIKPFWLLYLTSRLSHAVIAPVSFILPAQPTSWTPSSLAPTSSSGVSGQICLSSSRIPNLTKGTEPINNSHFFFFLGILHYQTATKRQPYITPTLNLTPLLRL